MVARANDYQPPRRFGNYRVDDLLGKGGMASVFRGEHTLLERPVAIKFLRRDIARSAAARQRFLREARLVAKLAHPNIVTVFDFGTLEDGTYYQASELVAGKTLREFLKVERLEPTQALRFARQLALGLASAHELGVIHRDLKPSNVMVVPDKTEPDGFRLKILDFGIAKNIDVDATDHVTRTGIMIGTPGYMSPEQCLGSDEIGPPSDIYSFGVVLFVMMCGRQPFEAIDTDHLLDQHQHEDPPPPSQLSTCSPQVDALVLRCLAKSSRDRFATMDEVLAVLDRELAGAPALLSPRPSAPLPAALQELPTAKLPPDTPRLMRLVFEPATGEPVTSIETTLSQDSTTRRQRAELPRRVMMIGIVGVIATVVTVAMVGTQSDRPVPAASQPPPARPPAARVVIDERAPQDASVPDAPTPEIDAFDEPAVAQDPRPRSRSRPKPTPNKPKRPAEPEPEPAKTRPFEQIRL